MRGWVRALNLVILTLVSQVSVAVTTATGEPMRILLDEDFLWLDRKAADELITNMKRAGFNVLVPCVWHGRGASWRSKLPKEPRWSENPEGLADPLGYLITRAHEAGIEVHPWFTISLRQREFYGQFREDGVPDSFFDVHNEQFPEFIRDVVLDVVRNYPVDGVNMDYIRSGGVCHSPACQQDYARRTGRSLLADSVARRISDTARVSIENWNGRAVENIVRTVATAVRAARPSALVSVSSHAGYDPFLIEGANSIEWLNAGLIDVILHMEYARAGSMRTDVLQNALQKVREPARLIMIAGNYDSADNERRVWARPPEEVAKALEFARTFNPAQKGAALYEYRFLEDSQIAAVRRALGLPASTSVLPDAR